MKEKKDRVDDALHATRAAIEEGIVPGGGVALLNTIKALESLKGDNEDETVGIQIIRKAIESPLRQICINAGVEDSVVVKEVMQTAKEFGYNAKTGEYVDMVAAGIIDPTKVTRVALQNAASVASMIMTTECALVPIPEENKQPQHGQEY
jgi:chaperonin GroEL